MDPQVDKQWALVRLFCEFTLLPQLLYIYSKLAYLGDKDVARGPCYPGNGALFCAIGAVTQTTWAMNSTNLVG